jgi:ABC-2 type transport system permease protein
MRAVGSSGTGTALDATTLAVTGLRVVRAEWRKFRTLRSNLVTLVAGAALSIAAGVLIVGVADPAELSENGQAIGESALNGLAGVLPLVFAVLGVLSATNEYASGLARVTFAAVPRRGQVVRAKVAVLSAVAAVTVALSGAVAFALGAVRYDDAAPYGSLADPGVLTTMGTAAVRTAAFAALGLGIGFLVRNGAGAIALLFGFLLAAPGVIGMIPTVGEAASDYLPMAAANAMTNRTGRSDLPPAVGAAVLLAWVAAGLVAAVILTHRRDA